MLLVYSTYRRGHGELHSNKYTTDRAASAKVVIRCQNEFPAHHFFLLLFLSCCYSCACAYMRYSFLSSLFIVLFSLSSTSSLDPVETRQNALLREFPFVSGIARAPSNLVDCFLSHQRPEDSNCPTSASSFFFFFFFF